jgi:hypothetical protein
VCSEFEDTRFWKRYGCLATPVYFDYMAVGFQNKEVVMHW